ncbi:MAG: glutamine--fructose-6-phosphate transaminase (isomerizing) [Alphaproteobacteria bacterium]
MCGIIGIVGTKLVVPRLIDSLKRLEYRGYDSAGIAVVRKGTIQRRRAEGKLVNLQQLVERQPLEGHVGIGHTRWATHGAPTENNAHPHMTDRVALVHNGIIENYRALKDELMARGAKFETDTDTEIVAHLLSYYLDQGYDPTKAMQATVHRLEGAFSLAVIFSNEEHLMMGARQGSPLVFGYGNGDDNGEMYLGSDALALAPLTRQICYLQEGDMVVLGRDKAQVFDIEDKPVHRPIVETAVSGALIGKGNFRHFMLKEIYEQPSVVGDTLASYYNPARQTVALPDLPFHLEKVTKVTLIACGTSFYACMIAKYWLETIARIPVEIDVASEFRYREAPLPEGGLAVFISQSGETADTLAALRYCKAHRQHILAVTNVPESSMERESHAVLQTHAGPEIGVASTKAFTCQLTVLACFALAMAKARNVIDARREAELVVHLAEVPARMAEVLNHDAHLKELAHQVMEARDVLYLGRNTSYPIALEGALKLKEISYIHAEGYAAGEMKHGPIALIDESVPVVVVAPSDAAFEKTASNLQEVVARGGKVILLSDAPGIAKLKDLVAVTIELPSIHPFVAPILYAIPVQLLAYHVAVLKGTDVDQPRNLAKSVTVE